MATNKLRGYAGVLQGAAGVVQGATQRGDSEIPIDLIDINPQVRTQFDPEKQASINASIAAQGINQSLVLHAKPNGRYDLVAGEYRIRGAFANDLKTVPARVRHNLSPWEIRRIQVSENMERADITAFDEAMGVAKDVEQHGFELAQQIWNRSEGWISKRTAVLKYAEPVRKLLQDGVSNDIEVAHSLNQLHQLDEQEYARLEKRLREGIPLSRDEVRGKVQQVKQWQSEAKQRDTRRQTLDQGSAKGRASTGKAAAPSVASAQDKGPRTPPPRDAAPTAAAPAVTNVATASTSVPQPAAPAADKQVDQQATAAGSADTASKISDEQALILGQMVTLFENGLANHRLVTDVQDELAELGADMNQTDWALWSLFQTCVLPLLGALGEQRSQRYLQRMIAELRSAKAQDLWNKLHPPIDGAASDDWSATHTPVAPMPKGWRF